MAFCSRETQSTDPVANDLDRLIRNPVVDRSQDPPCTFPKGLVIFLIACASIRRMMKTFLSLVVTFALTAATVFAQTKTIPGETITVTAKVEAIDIPSRTLTLKKPDGTSATFVVPAEYERFSGIKVGDTVTARYSENLVLRKLNPGEKPADSVSAGVAVPGGSRPNATVAAQVTVTTTITAIDWKIPSITLTGPEGRIYTSKVQDTALLKTLKVGDLINVTWTEAVSISVAAPK